MMPRSMPFRSRPGMNVPCWRTRRSRSRRQGEQDGPRHGPAGGPWPARQARGAARVTSGRRRAPTAAKMVAARPRRPAGRPTSDAGDGHEQDHPKRSRMVTRVDAPSRRACRPPSPGQGAGGAGRSATAVMIPSCCRQPRPPGPAASGPAPPCHGNRRHRQTHPHYRPPPAHLRGGVGTGPNSHIG